MTQLLRVLLFLTLLLALPSQLVVVVEDPGSYPYILAAKRQKAAVRKAMRYHGTNQAFLDGTTWYFHDRNGTTCHLFTQACQRATRAGEASES